MSKHIYLTLAICFLLLAGIQPTEPVTAQIPTPPELKKATPCSDNAISRYERWVTDMPCAPAQPPSDILRLIPTAENSSGNANLMDPNFENYVDLAFSSYRDGNWEIYFLGYVWDQFNALNANRITDNPASDILPRIRPGAYETVFSSNRNGNYDLFVTQGNDDNTHPLTTHPAYDSQAAWSADGVYLSFVSDRDGNFEIYRMLGDGTGLVRLTYDGADDFMPSWSPDGTQIIWVRAVDQQNGVIYAMNSDGTNPHPVSQALRYLQHPHMSGNGLLISFDYDANLDGWNDIGLMNTDGSNLHFVKLGENLVDYWAGSWINLPYRDFTFSRINYVVFDSELYIQSMCVGRFNLWDNGARCLENSVLETYPDSAVIDFTIPETHVLPLPEYTRAGNFPITVVGSDPGPAMLYSMTLQYRDGFDGIWTNWEQVLFSSPQTVNYSAQAGNSIFFRSQGRDWANHYESWPDGDGDTSTKIYAWQLEGQIKDNRGITVPKVTVQTDPAFFDQIDGDDDGHFHRYVPSADVIVDVEKSGYGILPSTMITSQTDIQYKFVLPPADNQINDGDFDRGLTNWSLAGNSIATQDMNLKHTGIGSAELNPTNQANQYEHLFEDLGYSSSPRVLQDSLGTLHLIWVDDYESEILNIYYSQKSQNGDWTDPIVVNPAHIHNSYIPEIAFGPDESLHVVWLDYDFYNTSNIYYASRTPDGIWSNVVDLLGPSYIWLPVENRKPEIAVDSQNTVHVVYGDQDGLWYINHPEAGTWSEPLRISFMGNPHEICIGPDDTLHVGYIEYRAYYRNRSVDGVWSNPEVLSSDYAYLPECAIDDMGTFRLIWRGSTNINYAERSVTGQWSSPIQINGDDSVYGVELVTSNNKAYVLWYGDLGLKIRYQLEEGNWSPIYSLSSGNVGVGMDFTVKDEHVQAFWSEGEGWVETDLAYTEWDIPQTITSSMSQMVTLTGNLHNPTLSFFYQTTETGSSGIFNVKINDQVVFSTSESTSVWVHEWVDLSPWLGQTIDLIFSTENNQPEGYLITHIDEISIGSWLTPMVTQVNPGQIDADTPIIVTITGENFMDTPSVRFNEILLTTVEWVDEHTIRCKLTEGLPAGFYDIWIINPNGQEGFKLNGLRVGMPVFMPIIQR